MKLIVVIMIGIFLQIFSTSAQEEMQLSTVVVLPKSEQRFFWKFLRDLENQKSFSATKDLKVFGYPNFYVQTSFQKDWPNDTLGDISEIFGPKNFYWEGEPHTMEIQSKTNQTKTRSS
jgi:hypothetical protein